MKKIILIPKSPNHSVEAIHAELKKKFPSGDWLEEMKNFPIKFVDYDTLLRRL